jgi:hypothetical protein
MGLVGYERRGSTRRYRILYLLDVKGREGTSP